MKMEIKTTIISTDTIKPSSPTPKHQQKHQLSLLDVLAAPVFAPFLYFYSSHSQNSNTLKKSLSETLSRFYPLAGQLIGNLYVHCNDRGVPFAEALANCHLSQLITNPDLNTIKKLLLYKLDESQDFCLAVQATYFRCGGLALGLLFSHKVSDALSMITFVNSWSSVARTGDFSGVPIPKFDATTYFPPPDATKNHPNLSNVIAQEEEVASRVFTFPAAKIADLQETYSTGDRRPSRVEALSVYVWTRFLAAIGMQANPDMIYNLKQAINVRSRVNPSTSVHHFGNIMSTIIATPRAGNDESELLWRIREAKKAVYNDYAAQLRDLIAQMESRAQGDEAEKVISFYISSLCGFPLYEADFGWGKPVWAVSPGFPGKNLALFTDSKSGGGIEVVVSLSKTDMDKFGVDLELRQLRSSL